MQKKYQKKKAEQNKHENKYIRMKVWKCSKSRATTILE
jgi:hypothetical protein